MTAKGLRVRVEAEKDRLVDERVLLLCPGTLRELLVGGSDNGLDLSAIDQSGHIRVRDLGSGETKRKEQE